jgi:hypothetical protein
MLRIPVVDGCLIPERAKRSRRLVPLLVIRSVSMRLLFGGVRIQLNGVRTQRRASLARSRVRTAPGVVAFPGGEYQCLTQSVWWCRAAFRRLDAPVVQRGWG